VRGIAAAANLLAERGATGSPQAAPVEVQAETDTQEAEVHS